jgi:DNA-binding CsgD family transcriptional regulator
MSPRNSKAKQAANQAQIVRGTVEGKTQSTIADELGVTRETVNRNLAELRKGFVSVSREEFSVYVKQQVELLTKAVEEVWEGKLPPEAANSIRGLMDSIARLTGSNAPTKSISANVNVDQQVIPIEQQLEYLQAFAGLYEDERLEELDRVKARKRTCRIVMDASWGQKQLPESGS